MTRRYQWNGATFQPNYLLNEAVSNVAELELFYVTYEFLQFTSAAAHTHQCSWTNYNVGDCV